MEQLHTRNLDLTFHRTRFSATTQHISCVMTFKSSELHVSFNLRLHKLPRVFLHKRSNERSGFGRIASVNESVVVNKHRVSTAQLWIITRLEHVAHGRHVVHRATVWRGRGSNSRFETCSKILPRAVQSRERLHLRGTRFKQNGRDDLKRPRARLSWNRHGEANPATSIPSVGRRQVV